MWIDFMCYIPIVDEEVLQILLQNWNRSAPIYEYMARIVLHASYKLCDTSEGNTERCMER